MTIELEKHSNSPDRAIFDIALLAGELLLKHGAETYRIESDIESLLDFLPNQSFEVANLLTGIWISYTSVQGEKWTYMLRVRDHQFNSNILLQVDQVCQNLVNEKISLQESYEQLMELKNYSRDWSDSFTIFIIIFTSAAFTVMCGGKVKECFYSAIAAFGLGFTQVHLRDLPLSDFISTFISAVIPSLILALLFLWDPSFNLSLSVTGSLLILFPGTTLTNSIRDTMKEKFLAGVGNFFSAIMTATALASGVGVTLLACKLNLDQPSVAKMTTMTNVWIASLGAGIGTMAVTYYLGSEGKILPINFVIGFMGWFVFLVLDFGNLEYFIQVLLSASLVGLLSWISCEKTHVPVTIFTVPSLYSLVPGNQLYLSVNALIQENYELSALKAGEAFLVACAIAIGLLLVETFFSYRENYRVKKKNH